MASSAPARDIVILGLFSISTFLIAVTDAQNIPFRPLTAANGSTLCAVGNPTSSIAACDINGLPSGVPDVVGCAFRCSGLNVSGAGCLAFNYVNNGPNDELCQFYQYRPSRCIVDSPGCLHYEVTYPGVTSTNQTCSLPFTFKGQLYNKYTPVGNSPSVVMTCYSANSTWVKLPTISLGTLGTNVALGKPTYQISTYSSASLAVDGGLSAAACTSSATNPWWVVDIGQPGSIIAVNVTNDDNPNSANRLDNFIVRLANTQPTVGNALTAGSFTQCGQYSGSVPAGSSVLVSCALSESKFRYVIIQSSLTSAALCLMEVMVFLGYDADNITTNVTIPVTLQRTPVKSMNGWLVILQRINNNFPLNRNWTIYKSGFGNALSNFWLGLENLYQLTSEQFMSTCGKFYRLRVELQSAASGRWYSEEYDWFYVDGESNGYALHVPTSGAGDAGDAGDAINSPTVPTNSINGMQFYSYDRNNSNQCAAKYGGGWWYNNCSSNNMMGSPSGGFNWNELVITGAESKASNGTLIISRMMIKSVT